MRTLDLGLLQAGAGVKGEFENRLKSVIEETKASPKPVILFVDEAHRGFDTRGDKDKPTIVRRLVNGHAGYPPIPIVWGISATIARFNKAMELAQGRAMLPNVIVDSAKVQEAYTR